MENLELENIASQVRRDILRMVSGVNSGHPGGSLGCADFLTLLYFDVLNHNPKDFTMDGKNEDLFFLSNGHISPVWYSVLARAGYFPVADLGTFRKLSSKLQGHPSTDKKLPGIRMASGSLGQGLSVAIGAALSKKLNGDKSLVFTEMGNFKKAKFGKRQCMRLQTRWIILLQLLITTGAKLMVTWKLFCH
jgi:transketolase